MVVRKFVCIMCRFNKPVVTLARGQCNTVQKEKMKTGPKPATVDAAPEVLSFLESPEYDDVREHLPNSVLVKYKSIESLYLVNRSTARFIVNKVGSGLREDDVLVEVNPGVGVLTEELLKSQKNKIHLFETSAHYNSRLKELQQKYPNRINIKTSDFFGMWKLAFRDKMDNGTRMKDLLDELIRESNGKEMKVLGAMASLNFIKHLIFTILFHNNSNVLGRPDLFIAMPSYSYAYLREDSILNQKKMYRATPALFQVLFDCKVLAKIPRSHFMPWEYPMFKRKMLNDDDSMLIVNIKQKRELPCNADSLSLLWYFFRPHIMFRNNRVIPSLEQWIPGCGVWLISGQDPPDTNKALAPGAGDAPLPHMTIFTQYGDLTIPQKLTLFKRFVSWPEFEQCPFRASMENNLPKSISGIDEKDASTAALAEDADTIEADLDDEKHL